MINLPALRLSQFGITFYQAAIPAKEIERLVRFEVISYGDENHAKKKKKRDQKVNWSVLEERIQRSAEAFQRPIIGKKIEELVKFYEERREHRDLPAVPGAVLLVSEKPLHFVPQHGSGGASGTLELPDEEGVLRTLDGQHRLLALHALAGSNEHQEIHALQVPAVIFDALQPAQSVEMFVTINTKHTRLKPDLIVALAGKKLYPDKKTALAHDILRSLSQREDSALHHDIKILGVGPGKVSQAPLATEMARVFDDLEAAGLRAAEAFYEDAQRFFMNYFKQIAKAFPTAWSGRKYSIKSSGALRAFIRVSPTVVAKLRKHHSEVDNAHAIGEMIVPWRDRIGDRRFETDGLWEERGGQGSVERLAQELRNALAE